MKTNRTAIELSGAAAALPRLVSVPDFSPRPALHVRRLRGARRQVRPAGSTRFVQLERPAGTRAEDVLFVVLFTAGLATIGYCVASIWLKAQAWPGWEAWVARLNGG